jgi:hypothetical protein
LLTSLAEHDFAGPLLIEHEDLLSAPAEGIASARDYLSGLACLEAGQERTW